ncbi:MAG: hypothetical protein NC904_07875 [Candidatus Omnitrophica bacterium]|nr:hypothetical protein [Candidatus Omnitrophota bacterium]
MWRQFIPEVRLIRDGDIAKGVDIKVTQTGATINREEMEKLVQTYIKALEKYWK